MFFSGQQTAIAILSFQVWHSVKLPVLVIQRSRSHHENCKYDVILAAWLRMTLGCSNLQVACCISCCSEVYCRRDIQQPTDSQATTETASVSAKGTRASRSKASLTHGRSQWSPPRGEEKLNPLARPENDECFAKFNFGCDLEIDSCFWCADIELTSKSFSASHCKALHCTLRVSDNRRKLKKKKPYVDLC